MQNNGCLMYTDRLTFSKMLSVLKVCCWLFSWPPIGCQLSPCVSQVCSGSDPNHWIRLHTPAGSPFDMTTKERDSRGTAQKGWNCVLAADKLLVVAVWFVTQHFALSCHVHCIVLYLRILLQKIAFLIVSVLCWENKPNVWFLVYWSIIILPLAWCGLSANDLSRQYDF